MVAGKMKVHYSSKTDNWATPQWLFDKLNAIYDFDLDVCANSENAKFWRYYSPDDYGLKQTWTGRIWMNPPYGRTIGKWVKKAYQSAIDGSYVVALLPARTDTKWFHDYIYGKPSVTVEFVKGRLRFGNSTQSAPFPSMIVVFGSKPRQPWGAKLHG